MYNLLMVAIGGGSGAVLRWGLSQWSGQTALSLGMLTANWLGAFLIGVLAQWLDNPHYKLLLITGFLGGLTTFSSFSLEVVTLIQNGRFFGALMAVVLHVLGSLALTALGMYVVQGK
ncbi:fluoride efflux transporter CrcB [Moraxella nasovis]|uniref:fluoride efflux transporter CrcB n=1 Tax=Moraxella nasovis TaxID=2904121 RepID=UPI001F610268|nr:fluoride efflux transporter CrcB [Moraxella nasovis]UNU73829.1 fluoride efflux transporter CrcB [Moraxella nasovis]